MAPIACLFPLYIQVSGLSLSCVPVSFQHPEPFFSPCLWCWKLLAFLFSTPLLLHTMRGVELSLLHPHVHGSQRYKEAWLILVLFIG